MMSQSQNIGQLVFSDLGDDRVKSSMGVFGRSIRPAQSDTRISKLVGVALICFLCLAPTTAFTMPQTTTRQHGSLAPSQRQQKQHGRYSLNNLKTSSHHGSGLYAMSADDALQMASSTTSAIAASPLFDYFLQTVIAYAVPAFFAIVIIFFGASAFKDDKSKDDKESFPISDKGDSAISELYSDLYGEGSKKNKDFPDFAFGGSKPQKTPTKNLGIPTQEYIKITSLNEKFDSYDYSINAATQSKAAAAAKYRSKSFDRALQLALGGDASDISNSAKANMIKAEKEFLDKGKPLVEKIQFLESLITREVIDKELENLGVDKFELDPETEIEAVNGNETESAAGNETKAEKEKKTSKASASSRYQEVSKLQKELRQAELDFIQDLVAAIGPEKAYAFKYALLGDVGARGSGGLLLQLEDRPLSSMLSGPDQKSLFVMRFPGDVTASQLNGLREEVTAVIRNAQPGDEVVVVLQSGGGTVTGYGLAAGQLVRLKENGIFLTIAVEQVAASGGYMMTCVADKIVASPFAVLGSIGVISEIPNFYERLVQEGIEYQTVTAGKFKRTITPTKKVTPEDYAKAKEDVEMILTQFSGFVKQNRPSLDIESVATGETWFGDAALEKGLCDEIGTIDDVLLKYVSDGYKVFDVEYSPPAKIPDGLAGLFASALPASSDSDDSSVARSMIRFMVKSFAEEIMSLDGKSSDIARKYMARDDSADRTRLY